MLYGSDDPAGVVDADVGNPPESLLMATRACGHQTKTWRNPRAATGRRPAISTLFDSLSYVTIQPQKLRNWFAFYLNPRGWHGV